MDALKIKWQFDNILYACFTAIIPYECVHLCFSCNKVFKAMVVCVSELYIHCESSPESFQSLGEVENIQPFISN